MEGSVGVRVGTRTRVGYQALAHLLGLGPERAGCQDYRSRQGRFTRGLLYLKLLVGLGRLLNPEGHRALNVHDALKLSLSSHLLGLCSQMFDLIALPLSLYVFMDQHRSLVRNWLRCHGYRYNLEEVYKTSFKAGKAGLYRRALKAKIPLVYPRQVRR